MFSLFEYIDQEYEDQEYEDQYIVPTCVLVLVDTPDEARKIINKAPRGSHIKIKPVFLGQQILGLSRGFRPNMIVNKTSYPDLVFDDEDLNDWFNYCILPTLDQNYIVI